MKLPVGREEASGGKGGNFPVEKEEPLRREVMKLPSGKRGIFTAESYETSQWEGRKLPVEKEEASRWKGGSFPVERREVSRWRRRKLHGRKGESVTVESYEAFQWKASR